MPISSLLFVACTTGFDARSLTPYENPFTADDPQWAEQPFRSKPQEVAVAGDHAWVSLPGTADVPDERVALVDLATGELVRHVTVGSNPTGVTTTPDGEHAIVFNRFSNWASVVRVDGAFEVERIPTDFYATEGAFAPDGTLWVTNRWKDTVSAWELDDDWNVVREHPMRVGVNPRDVAVSPDGRWVAVANVTGMDVSIVDAEAEDVVATVSLGAPPNGLAFAGEWLVVATLGAATHHLPFVGPDTDGDGLPGDGTPNSNFQDAQNEIAVVDPAAGEVVHRYTSDTICCKDFRDVDPRDEALRGDLLPPEDTWIVGGALPEQVVADGDGVWVTYSGSDQFQRFAIDPATGALSAGEIVETAGHNPHGVAVAGDGRVLVAHRLGETIGVYRDGQVEAEIVVGDLSGGAFPATDAEIGELYNFVTSKFSVDGDQVCASCHREQGNIDKVFGMPLSIYGGQNSRMTMAARGAADTRPWFFEGAMDQTNFRPVVNEFARVENFCCEDYTLFPDGAPADCASNPPPECASEPNAYTPEGITAMRGSPYAHERPTSSLTRDAFFEERAAVVFGRTTTFGDGVFDEDPITGARTPRTLNLDGITKALGVFLLQNTALLPNPNDPDSPAARRGKAIFESASANCDSCHPAPAFTVSTTENPFDVPLLMDPVVTPDYAEDGVNLDLVSEGFMSVFPLVEQESCTDVCDAAVCEADPRACDDIRDLRLSPAQLRGVWDRAPSLLHHGRARGLREAICTPGHPALQHGETGFNERDGVPDTNGGTSHLSAAEIADLIAYLETL